MGPTSRFACAGRRRWISDWSANSHDDGSCSSLRAQRRNPRHIRDKAGLLRCARNDGCGDEWKTLRASFRDAPWRSPGIHNHGWGLWILGSMLRIAPGLSRRSTFLGAAEVGTWMPGTSPGTTAALPGPDALRKRCARRLWLSRRGSGRTSPLPRRHQIRRRSWWCDNRSRRRTPRRRCARFLVWRRRGSVPQELH
jgi:hypothetical protein